MPLMNANELVEAAIARAEAALETRDAADLSLAQQCLMGCLDWAAKQIAGDEELVRSVLRLVTDELTVARAA